MHSQIIRAGRIGEIRQFLAVVVARVTGDVKWHESVFIRIVLAVSMLIMALWLTVDVIGMVLFPGLRTKLSR
jgi:hypothetical protein